MILFVLCFVCEYFLFLVDDCKVYKVLWMIIKVFFWIEEKKRELNWLKEVIFIIFVDFSLVLVIVLVLFELNE